MSEPKEQRLKEKEPNERQRYFGDMQPRREDWVIDLTPFSAAIGKELISTAQYGNGRSVVKRRGRPRRQRAL